MADLTKLPPNAEDIKAKRRVRDTIHQDRERDGTRFTFIRETYEEVSFKVRDTIKAIKHAKPLIEQRKSAPISYSGEDDYWRKWWYKPFEIALLILFVAAVAVGLFIVVRYVAGV